MSDHTVRLEDAVHEAGSSELKNRSTSNTHTHTHPTAMSHHDMRMSCRRLGNEASKCNAKQAYKCAGYSSRYE